MSADLNIFKTCIATFVRDERITVWHMAIMQAIFQLATKNDASAPIFISRKRIMELAHILSYNTYHKCIDELQQFGYLQYVPSYHPGIRSRVFLLK